MTSLSVCPEWAASKSLQISLDAITTVRTGERKLKSHSNDKIGLLPNTCPICLDTGPGRGQNAAVLDNKRFRDREASSHA